MFTKIQKDSESLRSKYGRESFKVMGSSRYVLRLWDLSMRCGTFVISRGRCAPSMAANRGTFVISRGRCAPSMAANLKN
jgi:hypothetical protein